ncbi:MAG TPA: hypothetical protein VHB02_00680 [Acidimicrobiales bacterium]|nr:hypothetical protein [Acidimicrobiales bacterium]
MVDIRKILGGSIAVAALTVGSLAAVGLGSAGAATTGYPGTTTTTTAPTTTTTAGKGAPGSPTNPIPVGTGVTITIAVGSGTVYVVLTGFPPNVTISFTINGTPYSVTTSSTPTGSVEFSITVTDPHISLNGGTPVVANTGDNPVTVSGGGVSKTFIVNIPATAATTSTGSGTGTSTTSTSLAFTGADIAATVVGGLLLVAIGTLLVVFTRRRGARQHS